MERTEIEAIGDDTLGLNLEEMKAFRIILESILNTTREFRTRIEAEYLLKMVTRKLAREG